MASTIKEVAKKAGVSITTVSNVLNGNYKNMSKETRLRKEKAMEVLNYYPNIGARSLPRKGKTNTICIVIPHNVGYTFNHPYFAGVMKGIAQIIDEKGYRAMILTTKNKNRSEINYLKSLKRGLVDGFLFFDIEKNDPYVREFLGSNIRFMVVGRYSKKGGNYVDTDIEKGAYLAVAHLIKHGHKDIGIITGPEHMIFSSQIVEGYKRALKKYKIKCCMDNIFYGEFTVENGYDSMQEMLKMYNRATAVFSASQQTTLGLIKALKEKDLEYPKDMALISFGERHNISFLGSRLTYIKQPEIEVGCEVMKKLMELIETEKYDAEPEILPLELIIGTSCGCL